MKKFDQINVIPFIDIMLVLLTIVLMTASFISQGKIKVNIPKATTATPLSNNDIAYRITVTAAGKYYLNDKLSDIEQLTEQMKDWAKNRPITLKIDANAAFNEFVQISDLLRRYRLNNVQVVTKAD